MKKFPYVLCLMLASAFPSHAFSGECKAEYAGSHIALPEADAKFLGDALSFFKNKKRQELLAISDKQLLLVRRYISGGVDARGGNLWLSLKPRQIDKDLVIHIPPMKLPEYLDSGTDRWVQHGGQTVGDFSEPFFHPETDGTAVSITRKICDKAKSCDILPFASELEDVFSGLLHCNANKKAAYVFSDGLLITDMELMPWPIGTALYFSKHPDGYKLAALISFQ